jgi:hypothetical protein
MAIVGRYGVAREIYNLIWTRPSDSINYSGPAMLQGRNVVDVPRHYSRAVILFPSLLSPLVYVEGQGEPWFELLVTSEVDLTPDMINRQLRISPGLDSFKRYDPQSLFGGPQGNIEVEGLGDLTDDGKQAIHTHSVFSGVVHSRIARQLMDRGMGKVHRIRIKADISTLTARGTSNSQVFSETYSCDQRRCMSFSYEGDPNGDRVVGRTAPAINGLEEHDEMIRDILETLQPNSPIAGEGLYAFVASGSALDLMSADPNEPIQSYHPIYVFTGADRFIYANLGYVSDSHVNSRLDLLAKTPARVIEYGRGVHEDESPPISQLLMENTRSFHSVLHKILSDECQALVLGGDFIDHIRNAYTTDLARHSTTPLTAGDIWYAVDIENNYTDTGYPPWLDMIAFYSLVLRACREHRKPTFALSGNHDAYFDAYGISPRIRSIRANPGIPGDLNLTFYEALLAFGPSSGLLFGSPLRPEMWLWFYTVFTPFQDYAFKLPRQTLLCMTWGEHEDSVGLVARRQGPGIGHLPRSDDSSSASQLALLDAAIRDVDRKVILCSHYTLANYYEAIPMYENESLQVRTVGELDATSRRRNSFEMGCFETNREAIFDRLHNKQIQILLSGHAHRRGVYLIESSTTTSMRVRMYDAVPGTGIDLSIPPTGVWGEPAIVVSDSSGPYPKHNRNGEFCGFGPELPSGTVVRFHSENGAVVSIGTVQGERNKPRAAVGLDFVDVEEPEGYEVFRRGCPQSHPVRAFDHNRGDSRAGEIYRIRMELHEMLHDRLRICIRKVVFAGRVPGGRWIRVESTGWDAGGQTCRVAASDNGAFRDFINLSETRERFMVVYAASNHEYHAQRLDWSQPWIFEVRIERHAWGNGPEFIFKFVRPSRLMRVFWIAGDPRFEALFPEVPNWDQRMRQRKYQRTQGTGPSQGSGQYPVDQRSRDGRYPWNGGDEQDPW